MRLKKLYLDLKKMKVVFKVILIGVILPVDFVPSIISKSLLFSSFVIATFLPIISWRVK